MKTYLPKHGTLAALVVDFFRHNEDEELTARDIASKFDTGSNGIKALLQAPVSHGLLMCTKQPNAGLLYRAGPALNQPQVVVESVAWHLTPQSMPDAEITVLLDLRGDSVGTWPGYWDGEAWIDAGSGCPVVGRVVAWADMPAGSGL